MASLAAASLAAASLAAASLRASLRCGGLRRAGRLVPRRPPVDPAARPLGGGRSLRASLRVGFASRRLRFASASLRHRPPLGVTFVNGAAGLLQM